MKPPGALVGVRPMDVAIAIAQEPDPPLVAEPDPAVAAEVVVVIIARVTVGHPVRIKAPQEVPRSVLVQFYA